MVAIRRKKMDEVNWDDCDRRAIGALESSVKGEKPEDPSILIDTFFDAYACLLKDGGEWKLLDNYLARERPLRRSDLRKVSISCQRDQNGFTWPCLFVVTCLWGFSNKDKAGAVKLFYAMRTPKSREIIITTAEKTLVGQLGEAFQEIRNLEQIGASYASKFLYAVGTSNPNLAPSPLVLDSIVNRGLQRIIGKEIAADAFAFNHDCRTLAAAGYVNYCNAMARWATSLSKHVGSSLSSEDLELLMFIEGKSKRK